MRMSEGVHPCMCVCIFMCVYVCVCLRTQLKYSPATYSSTDSLIHRFTQSPYVDTFVLSDSFLFNTDINLTQTTTFSNKLPNKAN